MSEPDYLSTTRAAYDVVAEDYAEMLSDELAGRPLDRAMLGAFAELVLAADVGPVADLGCGPGRVTAHLHELGVPTFGVDLSPGMVEVARRRHPGLRFEVGSITALALADSSVGGVLAWYSLIHTPPAELPVLVAELDRVLAPGGLMLVAFQVGDERVHRDGAYGHAVSYDAYRRPPEQVAALLTGVGLEMQATLVREPQPPEHVPQAYLLARKPKL